MNYSFDAETEYFISAVRSSIKGERPAPPKAQINWERFIALSKKHEMYSTVAGFLPYEYLPQKEAEAFNNYTKSELTRAIAMQSELSSLEAELNKNEVGFMLLKGSRIKKLYPKESMRQMSDVDILYDVSKRDRLLEIMESYGYEHYAWSDNSDDFKKKPFYTFEFHRELFFDEYGFCPDFGFVWEDAERDAALPYKYIMSDDDLYLHGIAHMYKHKLLGGMGLRFLSDTYLMLKKLKLDFGFINRKLTEMGIFDFGEFIKKLSVDLFDENELNEEQLAFLSEVMEFGIFGDGVHGKRLLYDTFKKETNSSSLFRYALSRMFPKAEFMKRTYPVLNKKPYLLPYYYLKRLIYKSFHSSKKAVEEMKTINSIKNDEEK